MKSGGNGRQAGQEERKLEIEILHLIEGAKKAEGIAVVIDVFRAFSMECYLYAFGAREVRPVGSIGETFAWREKDPECILAGERHGRRIEGCDLGNSPSAVTPAAVRGKRVIHTTSAGTQGIVNAGGAEEILTGSFVNAKATAEYILAKQPRRVSLVAMGREGLEETEEDELCAAYLKSLLTGAEMPDIDRRLWGLRSGGGSHFFDPALREVYPQQDFWMCIARDRFHFVLRAERDGNGLLSVPVGLGHLV